MNPSIVFDTNVLISATLWENSVANKLFSSLIKNNITIYSSYEILKEYSKVLIRDFKYSRLETFQIISKFIAFLEIVHSKIKIDLIKEDPEDNKIIECALESNSQFILTYDKHLLKINKYCNIFILTPDSFLKNFQIF